MSLSPSKITLLSIAVIAGLAIASYLWQERGQESTDDAALNSHTVTLSPKVPGYVKSLTIKDNQRVKAGEVLLEIDPTDYLIRRDKALAAYEAAKAAASASHSNMESTNISAPSNRDAAQAQVESATANWEKAKHDLQRMQKLSNEARSQEQLDVAIANEKANQSSLIDARAKLRTAETAPKAMAAARALSEQLSAQFNQAKADLAQADNDLANTKLLAAIDGIITNRGVEQGNYVQVGQYLASLVGTELWITANYKETQLEHIRIGQTVTVTIDAYPELNLKAKVDSIQSGTGAYFSAFPPQNATGNFVKIVQRVPVKIVFDTQPDTALSLGPGMSVIPTVDTVKR
jgi:membrane fusion protein (multidrug efflux system)